MIVYISIGNSDDKLTQRQWSDFVNEFEEDIRSLGQVHGAWYSAPDSPWQNACICVELIEKHVAPLKAGLARMARYYMQDSIAWAEAPATEFIEAAKP